MQHRLAELRRRRAAGEGGFTLIELLVVVVIIGILIAIAIPVYLNYQKGAKDKSAASDLRNAVSALEQCNSDNSTYPASIAAGVAVTSGAAISPCTTVINLSAGTTVQYYGSTTAVPTPAYLITSTNTGGSGKIYCYSSAAGGAIISPPTSAVTTYRAAC